jgi:hypothetical protein
MIERLRVALPIGVVVGAVALFIVTVVIPDPSTVVLCVVVVGGGWIAAALSIHVQRRRGLRGASTPDTE